MDELYNTESQVLNLNEKIMIYLPSWVIPKPDAIAATPTKSSLISTPEGKVMVLILAEEKKLLY